MAFNQEAYHDFILNYKGPDGKGIVGFFPERRELASGRMSFWYFNGRVILHYAELLKKLAGFVLDFCKDNNLKPDYFVNVPEGINQLTDYLNILHGGKQVMARAKPKEHGDPRDANFIGPVEKGDKVVIVEDVTTTGGSLAEIVERCLDAGLDVIATLCECNRMEKAAKGRGNERKDFDFGVEEFIARIRERGIRHYSLTDATKILPLAFKLWAPPQGVLKQAIAEGVREEYSDHGIIGIDLKV